MAVLVQSSETSKNPVIAIAAEAAADLAEREALLDRVMPARRTRSSESLRRGYRPAEGLAFVARDASGALVGTVRLGDISAGIGRDGRPVPALLLGPLAVAPEAAHAGVGSALMHHAIAEAGRLGHAAILLVGDAPYYGRFGFSAEKTATLTMPGFFERGRFLALELAGGALDGATGVLFPTGRKEFEGGLPAAA
ncbi:MAG: GNAT family N-acetyltransferase [Pararhizobium sp.]